MSRENSAAPELRYVATQALIFELERRSLGCMLAVVRADESGDAWSYALKGSPILLGALSASLSVEVEKKLMQPGTQKGGTHDRRNCLRHPGAS